MKDKCYTVYMHICPNGKKYIGITRRNPEDRWNKGQNYRFNKHFTNAIKKYDWSNIQHIILFTNLSKEQAEQKEIELIAKYKTTNQKNGYNIENGGNSIGKHSDSVKKKMSESQMGEKNHNFNKPHTKEWKEYMSKIMSGKNNGFYGKTHTKEVREKLRKAHLGKPNIACSKKVICVETSIIYNSIEEAKRKTNILAIGEVCRKNRKTAGGYHWKYYELDKEEKEEKE